MGLLLTKLFMQVYPYELMHFEMFLTPEKRFVKEHTNQRELDELMSRKKLDIEIQLDGVEFQEGRHITIKFIQGVGMETQRKKAGPVDLQMYEQQLADRGQSKSFKYKTLRFSEQTNGPYLGLYWPENLRNQKIVDFNKHASKFIERVLFLMTLDLSEIY